MTADEFVKAVRSGKDKLRLDRLVLTTPERQLTGKGMLRIENEKLHIDMTLDEGMVPPNPIGAGVVSSKDFWKMEGLIENNLPFRCNYGPGPSIHSSNGIVTLSETVNPIDLGKQEWRIQTTIDPDSGEEREEPAAEAKAILSSLFGGQVHDANEAEQDKKRDEPEGTQTFEFHAWISDFELKSFNGGSKTVRTNDYLGEYASRSSTDTLMGETSLYSFAFIQEDEDGKDDLHIVIRSKEGISSKGEESDRKKFYGLLNALAFTHGKNAWPYRVKYWCGHAQGCDTVTTIRDLPSTPHAPFSGLKHNVDLATFIGEVATRFADDSTFSKKLTYLLFLFRQAGNRGIHHEVSTLAICSLFESLVRVLFDHLDLGKETLEAMSLPEFMAAKEKLRAYLETWPNNDASKQRLVGLVRSANPLTMREMLAAVCKRLGLDWESEMSKVFAAWKAARNPLAHGKFGDDEDHQGFVDIMHGESRIAGGFNTLLLKFFGYSGYYNPSVFEPGFKRMSHQNDVQSSEGESAG